MKIPAPELKVRFMPQILPLYLIDVKTRNQHPPVFSRVFGPSAFLDIFHPNCTIVHIYMTDKKLTLRQQQVLDFIRSTQLTTNSLPTIREISAHFGFQSPNAAMTHIKVLRTKGFISHVPGRARMLRPLQGNRPETSGHVMFVPIFGSIPAGWPSRSVQEADGCVLVDVNTIGIRPTARTFALKVRGDSMIGKHIMDGDLAIIEHGLEPRTEDVVAALIDGQVTLKTFVTHRGKPHLKAENPRYPDLIPQQELQIQGVMVALMRKSRQ
jgi:repressor LexA